VLKEEGITASNNNIIEVDDGEWVEESEREREKKR